MQARPRTIRRKASILSGVLFDLWGECRLMSRDGCFVHREDPSEVMANLENYRPITPAGREPEGMVTALIARPSLPQPDPSSRNAGKSSLTDNTNGEMLRKLAQLLL
jgi:hypothetical protein